MDQHLIFLLLGLANGAVFASLALALVVTYRSSGVLNFATGTIALYGAYTYAFLRQGELLILIPGLPETVDLGSELSFWPAALLTLVITALLGLLLYLVVFRPLRAAPAVAKAVASIGVMVVHDRAHVAATRDRARCPWTRSCRRTSGPSAPSGSRATACGSPLAVLGIAIVITARLPLHPLRTAHPRRGRDREGRARQRHRARPGRRRQLDDQRRRGRDRRHPHRADRAARPGLLHAVHRSRARRRGARPFPVRHPGGRSAGSVIGMLQSEVTYFRSQHTLAAAAPASPSSSRSC